MSINCREDLLNRQAKVNEEIKSYTCRVLVCSGTGCIASGAQKIYEEMEVLCRDIDGVTVEMQKDVPHIGVIKTGCQGLCELGPLMRIEPYNYQYVHVQPEDCKEIVERTILEGQPVERLFYRDHETVCPHPDDIPFLNQQTRIVLKNLPFIHNGTERTAYQTLTAGYTFLLIDLRSSIFIGTNRIHSACFCTWTLLFDDCIIRTGFHALSTFDT